MYKGLTISVVVPTLNEEGGIEKVLTQVPPIVDEVLIVDGGSTDRTVEIAKAHGAKVVVEPKRGYGLAYLVGFKAATSDLIVTTDGDGTYPIECTQELVDTLIEKKADFMSGSRFPLEDVTSMHYLNFIGNSVMTGFVALLFKQKVTDIASGMWLFKRAVIQDMKFIDLKWNFSLEIKIEAMLRRKFKFLEHHIRYYERVGESKVTSPWTVGMRALWFCIKKRLSYSFSKKEYLIS